MRSSASDAWSARRTNCDKRRPSRHRQDCLCSTCSLSYFLLLTSAFCVHRLSLHNVRVRPERTEAIILQTMPARERDKLVIFITPDLGKRKGWAYGARSIKSRFGAALEPLAKVTIGFLEREGEEIVRIESVDLIRSLFPAQQNLEMSIAASYLAELVDTFAQPDDPSELIYRLLDKATETMLSTGSAEQIVAYSEMWMLRLAGILPSLTDCSSCHQELTSPIRFDASLPGLVCSDCGRREARIVPNSVLELIAELFQSRVAGFAEKTMSRDDLFELRDIARTVRRHFLGHELKSHDLLQGVLGRGATR